MKRSTFFFAILIALAWVGTRTTSLPEPTPDSERITAPIGQEQATFNPSESQKSHSATEKKAQHEKWFGAETIVAAQRAVRRALKDPSSALFKDVYANYTEAFGVVACGWINSKNSFGAYTGFKRFVSSGKSAILEGQDNITDAWVGACL
ncbi:MAG: hypothetical protein GXW93_14035 [Pseudomonas lactis]|nr:hypothetical protein [Pseudomonas lactis]